MPTERFLRLPGDKQDKILDAAEKGVLRISHGGHFQNRIIKDAGISRGSFLYLFQ